MRYWLHESLFWSLCVSCLGMSLAWAQEAAPPAWFAETRQLQSIAALPSALAEAQVIFVGETHPEYGDHLNQLYLLKALHQRYGQRLAVGVEWLQQPFQAVLDQYIAGQLDFAQLLDKSEYFDRWRYDPRLYQPILAYLQAARIPTLALNLPQEITRKVGKGGLDALSAAERAQLPELDRRDDTYRTRLEAVFNQHPGAKDFNNFYTVQLLWDEGMAERAVAYLRVHPDTVLLIFAGNGHLEQGSGIPNRIQRRLPELKRRIILNGGELLAPGSADFVLLHQHPELPPAPSLGVQLEVTPDGVLRVQGFAPQSAARAAGIRVGDTLLALEEQPVRNLAELKWFLAQQRQGSTLALRVLHKGWGLQQQTFKVTFPVPQAAPPQESLRYR